MIKFAAICPHPPIIIPEIGKGEIYRAQATVEAMRKLKVSLGRIKDIEKIFLISPHLPSIWDSFILFYPYEEELKGNFGDFGAPEVEFTYQGDREDAQNFKAKLGPMFSLLTTTIRSLDHGTLVPLYYLTGPGKHKITLLPLSFCSLNLREHYKFGKSLGEILKKDKKNWALIASGDLSHRLSPDAPAGYHPRGEEFDRTLVKLLEKKEVEKILKLEPELIEAAGECGLRSIVILLGILSHFQWKPKIYSYEGPFGVGYLVAEMLLER